MKVICIGHAAYDITIPFAGYPIENSKNRVENRIECGGGPASNAAYLLGKWGIKTYFAGVIGDDRYGRIIKNEFKSVNVNTKYLETCSKHRTTSSFIIANIKTGSRTVLTYRPSSMGLRSFKLNFKPDFILLDGQEVEMSHYLLDKYKDSISVIDAGRATDDIIALARKVNYLVCSKEFAEDVTKIKIDYSNLNSLVVLFNKMEKIFNNTIVVTLEDKGCLYKINNEVKIMPSIKVQAVDSTGAGDIFHGAFIYGLVKQYDFEKILKISNVAGALSVTKIGGRFSVPSISEMKEIFDDF